MKKNLFLLFILFLLAACTDDDKEKGIDDPTPVDYAINGKVEKGPFLKGSTVTLQPLDSKFNQIGKMFSATITDDEGNFDFGAIELTSPYVLLTTNGFFYDEVEDHKSHAPITLQAIVDLSDHSTVNVNILTHLKKDRLKKLVEKGSSYLDANKQAQTELLSNFGLQKYADTDVSQFSITAGTDEAAALIVVSSALLEGRSEAELTEELTSMSQDLTSSGKLSDKKLKAYRKKTTNMLYRYADIQKHIVGRYNELGKEVTVKDLSRYVDWDNDGIAGNEFGDFDGPVEMKFEKEELVVPAGGGVFRIKIESNAPYFFTNPVENVPGPGIGSDLFTIFNVGTISYTQKVENDVLILTVEPASRFLLENEILKLYSADGKVRSQLTIKQTGDNSKTETVFTENGKSALTSLFAIMRDAKNYSHTIEAIYSKTYQTSDYNMVEFMNPPVKAYNPVVTQAWGKYYQALRSVFAIKSRLPESPLLLSCVTGLEAMLYYDMAVLWENPFYPENFDFSLKGKQMTSAELLAKFESGLKSGIDNLTDKKSSFAAVEDNFFISKDAARLVLAKMYMYQKEYAKAAPLLDAVIQGNRYDVDNSRATALSVNSREMIYGLKFNNNGEINFFQQLIESGDSYLPVGTYAEVLLSAAECAYRLGNTNQAKAYLNKVIDARGLSAASGDFMASLQKVWESELKATFSYFAFLKRNGLAVTKLSLEEYQLVLPIPQNDIDMNPSMSQNPGYKK